MSIKTQNNVIVVNGVKYYKYLIIWEDIVGDASIAEFNDFDNMTCSLIKSEAYVFKKTSKYVWSFSSYCNENGEIAFGDRNIYPRSVIKKMIKI